MANIIEIGVSIDEIEQRREHVTKAKCTLGENLSPVRVAASAVGLMSVSALDTRGKYRDWQCKVQDEEC